MAGECKTVYKIVFILLKESTDWNDLNSNLCFPNQCSYIYYLSA